VTVEHPIEDAFAVAYDLTNTPIVQSEATGADGKFSLIVPDSIKEFKLQVHQKQVRYWDYRPNDPFSNKSHPHDLGEIVLGDKHELSENEAEIQSEAASLLYKLHDITAALLLDRTAQAYLLRYKSDLLLGCPAGIPNRLLVNYTISGQGLGTFSPRESEHAQGKMILSERTTLRSMQSIVQKEEDFFKRNGFYANLDGMRSSGFGKVEEFEPPGYCIELLPGFLNGRSFEQSDVPRPNYYMLFATPNTTGTAGGVNLYSDPSGIIRYSDPKVIVQDLRDALPVPPDFPLGIRQELRPARQ
jgi:hypothetical protein